MIKRVVVSGSRDYCDYEEAKKYIDFCISGIRSEYTIVFVSGGCRGADSLGEYYAKENGFDVEVYKAEWDKYGNRAGPLRNSVMAEKGDYFICFWDGKSKGTKNMLELIHSLDKPVRIKYIL